MNKEIKEMEKYAEKENIPIIQKTGINFLCKQIEKYNVKRILELGTAIGYSAILMSNVRDDIEIVSIERDESRYLEAVKNIKKCNKEKQIVLILGDALEVDMDDKFDMIFIDAAKAQNTKLFKKFSKNLNDNGIIVTDNMSFHGFVEGKEEIRSKNLRQLVGKIKKYIEFLKNNEEYETKFYKVGDGIAITTKKGE